MSGETLVEGLPGRRSIRRLLVSKDSGMRRPGGDNAYGRRTGDCQPGPTWPYIRRPAQVPQGLLAPARMGSRSSAKRLTAVWSFVFHTRNPCCLDLVPTASSMRCSPELEDFAITESQGHPPGRGKIFGTRTTTREP